MYIEKCSCAAHADEDNIIEIMSSRPFPTFQKLGTTYARKCDHVIFQQYKQAMK